MNLKLFVYFIHQKLFIFLFTFSVLQGSSYGDASLVLSGIKATDRGWYNCKVLFLNREPHDAVNGTWYFVEVQAKPKFDHHPDPVVYVSHHDSTVLACTVNKYIHIYFLKYSKRLINNFIFCLLNFRPKEIHRLKLFGSKVINQLWKAQESW